MTSPKLSRSAAITNPVALSTTHRHPPQQITTTTKAATNDPSGSTSMEPGAAPPSSPPTPPSDATPSPRRPFTFNPHKMLGAPQQTTAFIVRHRNALRNANAHGAKYLFDPRKNGAEYDLGDLSYTCGRSMRSSCGLCGNTTVKVDWEGVSIKRWRSWNCLWRRLEGGEGGLRWRVSLGRLM
mmetsp:Transcript_19291/g.41867  ORF Transcript_19291/g.41867 Transcript_19291/m.41867 type:complete len:182 (-) Transcript_19291:993-1538(-)